MCPLGTVRNGSVYHVICCCKEISKMGGEIFSTSILIFTLTLVGLGAGFLLLRIQGGEE